MGGFARIRCPRCQGERVLLDLAHHHVVFTVPTHLRGVIGNYPQSPVKTKDRMTWNQSAMPFRNVANFWSDLRV